MRDRRTIAGLFVPGGLFLGMGIGWALGSLVQGLFIGLGAAFVAMALAGLGARGPTEGGTVPGADETADAPRHGRPKRPEAAVRGPGA